MKDLVPRIGAKLRQATEFFLDTNTPVPLVLDAFHLKRSSFIAETKEGLKFRLNSGESFTFFENLLRRDYLAEGIELHPANVVVDIGANIGTFTVLAASAVGPTGKVFSYEPIPECAMRLQNNVQLNKLTNVSCYQAAISGNGGTFEIYSTKKSALASGRIDRPENQGAEKLSVTAFTLEQALNDNQIDIVHLLKIDCEGSEYEIFENMPSHVASRILQIAMEVHPVPNRSYDGLARTIESLGFEVRRRGQNWYAFRRP